MGASVAGRKPSISPSTLQWCYNERAGVSNHRCLNCLLNRLFRRRSKNTSKPRVTGLCEGSHRWPVNSRSKGQYLTRKRVPSDGVIMILCDMIRQSPAVTAEPAWSLMMSWNHFGVRISVPFVVTLVVRRPQSNVSYRMLSTRLYRACWCKHIIFFLPTGAILHHPPKMVPWSQCHSLVLWRWQPILIGESSGSIYSRNSWGIRGCTHYSHRV